ncbi:hypothetical protein CO037_01965 [Candidatus Pacearchaeota archaeon CG_4_9_14_0_2_um_filter_30_8]|nr:MAG: hypothetical protein CO037_01965 [Candidatus Pacearchaeota archaeon CG_4_9_14_0_2_um_filter_30_8]
MDKKKFLVFAIALVYLFGSLAFFVSAHSAEELAQAKSIIDVGTVCSQLNSTQLAMIGEYYMEQIHPGEAHEQMDAMMGGEGSQTLEQMHIAMAYRFYCDSSNPTGSDYSSYGMMGGQGMMGNSVDGYGMMNSYYNSWYNWILVAFFILIIGLIIAVTVLALKLKDKGKGKRK